VTVANQKRKISGPGAADFIAAPGGLDLPENSPDKGTSIQRDDSPMTDVRNLDMDFEPEDPATATERTILADEDRLERDRDPDTD
jgi:hypothetical protein